MPSRRDFLKGLVGATVSLQTAPAKRREVFVGKRRVKVVDVQVAVCFIIVHDAVQLRFGDMRLERQPQPNTGRNGGEGIAFLCSR